MLKEAPAGGDQGMPALPFGYSVKATRFAHCTVELK
jgi:hypothetical protein